MEQVNAVDTYLENARGEFPTFDIVAKDYGLRAECPGCEEFKTIDVFDWMNDHMVYCYEQKKLWKTTVPLIISEKG